MVELKRIPVGGFGGNCYLLWCSRTSEGVIVDPCDDAPRILKATEDLRISKIVITHGHADHIMALERVASAVAAPVAVHPLDADMLPQGLNMEFIHDGDTIRLGDESLRVMHTPGHTPGGVCLFSGSTLIAGDTIFPGGPGRTWSPEAFRQIIESIEEKVLSLDDGVRIFPGHGERTTVGEARREVAIFRQRQVPEDFYGEVTWIK